MLFDKETLAKKAKNFSFRGKETFIKEKPIHQPSNRSALYIRSGFSCNLYNSGFKRNLSKLTKDNKQSNKNPLFAFLFFYYPERFFDYQFVRSTPRSKVTKNVTIEQKLSLGTMIVRNEKWAFFDKTFS